MGLNHQKKILMYKNREQTQRAFALGNNQMQSQIHNNLLTSAQLKQDLEKTAHVRVQPDQYNYRSPQKYVSIVWLINQLR